MFNHNGKVFFSDTQQFFQAGKIINKSFLTFFGNAHEGIRLTFNKGLAYLNIACLL